VAVSCFPDPKQLLPVALEIVLISFRTGLFAAHVRYQIQVTKWTPDSWTVWIETGDESNVLQQLEEFCAEKVCRNPL
jgi:hypothetical protein